jgi:gliding motility-associated-like protein
MIKRIGGLFAAIAVSLVAGSIDAQTIACGDAFILTEDTILCEPENELTIRASTVWEWISIGWQLSPGAQLIDDSTVFVNTVGSELLRVTADIRMPNAILNGDFSAGNNGFTSGLIYSPVSILPPGTYTVGTDPAAVHPNFISCGDHTTGDGAMLIINGSIFANQNIWCQTVDVEPGATYDLSFWAASLDDKALPELVWRIDGVNQGDVLVPGPATCAWIQSTYTWTAGPAQTSAQLCIRNGTGANIGNDFVVDDISMTRLCTVEDSVRIQFVARQERWIDTLLCAGDVVQIGGIDYGQTSIDTFQLSGFRGCDSIVYVSVIAVDPVLTLAATGRLDCQQEEVSLTLQVSGASIGVPAWEWSDPSGLVIAGTGTSSIAVNQPGSYTVRYLLDLGGGTCEREAVVTIEQDIVAPAVDLGPDRELTCAMPEVTITAQIGDAGISPAYVWSNLQGPAPPAGTASTLTIQEAGVYVLEVENPDNGCAGTDTVIVEDIRQDLLPPEFTLGVPFCVPNSGWLEVVLPVGGPSPYTVTIEHENGSSWTGGPRFDGLPSGTYQLYMQDAAGCEVQVEAMIGPLLLPTISLPSQLDAAGQEEVLIRPQWGFADSLILSWEWQATGATLDCYNCPEAYATGLSEGQVEVCVVTVGECRVCASVRIDFERDIQVYFPTAFSPNGDGINDTFRPFAAPGLVRHYQRMAIYDRWGNALWLWEGGPQSDEVPAWDGEYRGKPMMPGVYVFLLDLLLADGTSQRYSGELQLLR